MAHEISKMNIKLKSGLFIGVIIMAIMAFYNQSINASKNASMLWLCVPLSLGIISHGLAVYIMKINVKRYYSNKEHAITKGKLAQKTGLIIIGFGLVILLGSLSIVFFLF